MTEIIRAGGVHKSFGGTPALQDLSFAVASGEIFGFLGPSGAGKTTTIKLLTRQLRPDRGTLEVFGRPVESLARSDFDRIGVLSDNSGVYDRLSVWDNIKLFASLKSIPAAQAEAVLEEVGLADQKAKKAKVLSKGMRQRLVLAVALLHRPALLFLDEPTAALDPATSTAIHRMLLKLNEGGTTIFLTTHNMEEADKLCHRVAFLNMGHIAELGAPAALKLKYAHNRVDMVLDGGKMVSDEKTPEGLRRLAQAAEGRSIEQLHSLEPNLEEIFLQVTGRELV